MSTLFSNRIACYQTWFLLVFVFLGFLLPWPALFRAFLFFGAFPLAIVILVNFKRNSCFFDRSIIFCFLLVFYVVASDFFLANSSLAERFQVLRWGVSTSLFFLVVVVSSFVFLENPRFYATLIFLIVGFSALFSTGYYFWSEQFPQRLSGFGLLGHPILGPSALLGFWGAGYILFFKVAQYDWVSAAAFCSSFIALFVYVFLTQSRGPLLSLIFIAICVLVFNIFMYRQLSSRKKYFLGLILLASFAVIASLWGSTLISNMIDRGGSYRLEIWRAVLDHPPSSWLFGVGASAEFSNLDAGLALKNQLGIKIEHPHNLFLSAYFYSGVVAILFLLLIFFMVARRIVFLVVKGEAKSSVVISLYLLMVVLLNATDGHRIVAPPSSDWMFSWFPLAFSLAFLRFEEMRISPNSNNVEGYA